MSTPILDRIFLANEPDRGRCYGLVVVAGALLVSLSGTPAAARAEPTHAPAGTVVVQTALGGELTGYDVDQNGTEGILTEYIPDGSKLDIAIETFDQSTGQIIKIVKEVKDTYGDFVTLGVVGSSIGLVEYQPERKFLHLLPFKYDVLNPLNDNAITGKWTPPLARKDRLIGVSESQGYSGTAVLGFDGTTDLDRSFVFGTEVANNTFGPVVKLPDIFSRNDSPVIALDTTTNDAIVAVATDVPELAIVDLAKGKFQEFTGLGAGHVQGIAVDSAGGTACTTTLNDYSVEFYNLATQTGFKEIMPGAGGEIEAGTDVQFDPLNDLFLIAQPTCSKGPDSCIEVFDTKETGSRPWLVSPARDTSPSIRTRARVSCNPPSTNCSRSPTEGASASAFR
jgi:hypothetical protein